MILLPELDRCNDQTFVSFLITVWKTAAKDRSLALLVLHYSSYPSTFSQSFLPFFPNPTTTVAWHPYQMNWGKKEAGAASHQAISYLKVQFQLGKFLIMANINVPSISVHIFKDLCRLFVRISNDITSFGIRRGVIICGNCTFWLKLAHYIVNCCYCFYPLLNKKSLRLAAAATPIYY